MSQLSRQFDIFLVSLGNLTRNNFAVKISLSHFQICSETPQTSRVTRHDPKSVIFRNEDVSVARKNSSTPRLIPLPS